VPGFVNCVSILVNGQWTGGHLATFSPGKDLSMGSGQVPAVHTRDVSESHTDLGMRNDWIPAVHTRDV
jgi:hypothetical protein